MLVVAHLLLEDRLVLLDERLALLLEAQPLRVLGDRLLPRGAPRGFRVGDDRRDLGEGVVLLLRDPGVAGQDDVRLRGRDGLEIDAVGEVVGIGHLRAHLLDLVLDPREDAVAVVVAVGGGLHDDRDDAQGQRGLVVTPRDGRDALGLLLDDGLAERVLDGDGEGADAGCCGGIVAGLCSPAAAGGEDESGGGRDGGERGARGAHGGVLLWTMWLLD